MTASISANSLEDLVSVELSLWITTTCTHSPGLWAFGSRAALVPAAAEDQERAGASTLPRSCEML